MGGVDAEEGEELGVVERAYAGGGGGHGFALGGGVGTDEGSVPGGLCGLGDFRIERPALEDGGEHRGIVGVDEDAGAE